MIASYSRTGGLGPPPESESLTVDDDGSLQIRRSSGTPAVGRFRGRLTPDETDRVRALAAAAEGEGSVDAMILPDSSLVTVGAGSETARYGDGAPPPGAWGELGEVLAELLDRRLEAPVAAIELVLGDDERSARLEHRGDDALAVDLSSLAVRAVLWKGYYELVGEWSSASPPGADARMTAKPGWSVDVPFDHPFEPGPGQTLHASALFGLGVGGGPISPVLASVAPAIPPAD